MSRNGRHDHERRAHQSIVLPNQQAQMMVKVAIKNIPGPNANAVGFMLNSGDTIDMCVVGGHSMLVDAGIKILAGFGETATPSDELAVIAIDRAIAFFKEMEKRGQAEHAAAAEAQLECEAQQVVQPPQE